MHRPSPPRRPTPEPYELDETRIVLVGTVLWLVALVGLLAADLLGASIPGWWPLMCLVGVVLGVAGLRVTAVRKQRRRAASRARRPGDH